MVYAQYGLFEKSEQYFAQALDRDNYSPALINMGNLFFMQDQYSQAMDYYSQAYESNNQSATALLCIARVNHEMENYGTVRKQYAQLKELNPGLAAQFAYLDLRGTEAGRAAEAAGVSEMVLWEDEE